MKSKTILLADRTVVALTEDGKIFVCEIWASGNLGPWEEKPLPQSREKEVIEEDKT